VCRCGMKGESLSGSKAIRSRDSGSTVTAFMPGIYRLQILNTQRLPLTVSRDPSTRKGALGVAVTYAFEQLHSHSACQGQRKMTNGTCVPVQLHEPGPVLISRGHRRSPTRTLLVLGPHFVLIDNGIMLAGSLLSFFELRSLSTFRKKIAFGNRF